MDNAEIIARLEEVVKTLQKALDECGVEKQRWGAWLGGSNEASVVETATRRCAAAIVEENAIVARIAAVRLAIDRLSQIKRYSDALTMILDKSDDEWICGVADDALNAK